MKPIFIDCLFMLEMDMCGAIAPHMSISRFHSHFPYKGRWDKGA